MTSTKRVRKWRKNNLLKDKFQTLKANAKRRGISFTINFEDFSKFAFECVFFDKRGISANSYHIDRIDEKKGYEKENLQMLTNIENIRKYYHHNRYTTNHSIFEPD